MASLVRRLLIFGVLLLSLLSAGLVSAAHDEKECINQETETIQNKSNSDKTDITHKKDKCCDKDNKDN